MTGKKKSKCYIKNWRPISLLNVGYYRSSIIPDHILQTGSLEEWLG